MRPDRTELTAALDGAGIIEAAQLGDAILAAWPASSTAPANLDDAISRAEDLAAELGRLLGYISTAEPVPTRKAEIRQHRAGSCWCGSSHSVPGARSLNQPHP
jgi:hypothetical protein